MNNHLRTHIINILEKGTRFDGRKPLDYRKISVETGVIKTAHGSARVKIGETEVLVGAKLEIGAPYPDSPDQGSLIIGAEFLPMASPDFESGPPGIEAIELARVVDRGIRESGAIDTKKLCIKKGEHVWIIVIDICTINASGNLFDASALAVLACLRDVTFPKVEDGKIMHKEPRTTKKMPLTSEPISVTVGKIGKTFIIDPSIEEEKVFDARLTVAIKEDNMLCAMQKGGNLPLSLEDINKMIDIAADKGKELRKLLEK